MVGQDSPRRRWGSFSTAPVVAADARGSLSNFYFTIASDLARDVRGFESSTPSLTRDVNRALLIFRPVNFAATRRRERKENCVFTARGAYREGARDLFSGRYMRLRM